jgi:hypothetical protein
MQGLVGNPAPTAAREEEGKFAGFVLPFARRRAAREAAEPRRHIAYRMRRWPEADLALPSARVLQMLSRMSIGPVTEPWFVERTGLSCEAATSLLRRLVEEGSVERIELAQAA